jgi:hypothetical protein
MIRVQFASNLDRSDNALTKMKTSVQRQRQDQVTNFVNGTQFKIRIGKEIHKVTGRIILQMFQEIPDQKWYPNYSYGSVSFYNELTRYLLKQTFGENWQKDIRLLRLKTFAGRISRAVLGGADPVISAYRKCLQVADSLKLLNVSNRHSGYAYHCRLTQEGEQLLGVEGLI